MLPNFLKKHIPQVLFLLREYYCVKPSPAFSVPNDGKPKAYIFLSTDYGNLGDVAINVAQRELLERFFPTCDVIDVPASLPLAQFKAVCKQIRYTDLITIIGGGNMGDIYSMYEMRRQLVVKLFPKNRIISFPQTTDFSSTERGQAFLRSAVNTYRRKNLLLLAREHKSYEFMRKHFTSKCIETPDVVMALNRLKDGNKRGRNIMFCFRNDKEKVIGDGCIAEMENISHLYGDIKFADTHIGDTSKDLRLALESFLYELSHSRLMLTDRLHGMIFAFITGTPCIVFDNSNGKVGQCYKWIKNCKYVRYLGKFNAEKFKEAIDSLIDIQVDFDATKAIQQKFQSIFTDILKDGIQN